MTKNNSINLALTLVIAALPFQTALAVDWTEVELADNTFGENTRSYQSGDYEILVEANSALEFKVNIAAGDTIVYNWTVDMYEPEKLTSEFHGHTPPVDDKGTVMFYKIHQDGYGSGSLTSPFDGDHGWYLNNESDEAISVILTISGFYEDI